MYKIDKIKNYRQFAEILEKNTGFSVDIKVLKDDGSHVHYQLSDRFELSLGVLCIDNGTASFAPFVTHQTARDSQYINIGNLVMFDDFVKLLGVFKEMFVEDGMSAI